MGIKNQDGKHDDRTVEKVEVEQNTGLTRARPESVRTTSVKSLTAGPTTTSRGNRARTLGNVRNGTSQTDGRWILEGRVRIRNGRSTPGVGVADAGGTNLRSSIKGIWRRATLECLQRTRQKKKLCRRGGLTDEEEEIGTVRRLSWKKSGKSNTGVEIETWIRDLVSRTVTLSGRDLVEADDEVEGGDNLVTGTMSMF